MNDKRFIHTIKIIFLTNKKLSHSSKILFSKILENTFAGFAKFVCNEKINKFLFHSFFIDVNCIIIIFFKKTPIVELYDKLLFRTEVDPVQKARFSNITLRKT